MTAHDFRIMQAQIGCNNVQLGKWLGISPITVSRYRGSGLDVPGPVALSMQALASGWRP